MSLIYCFGIIGDKINHRDINAEGFDSQKIDFIKFKDILAAYCEVSETVFSQDSINKNAKKIEWVEKYGKIHEDAVEKIKEFTTIIPMKFCTVFTALDRVMEMMEEKYADFKFNLNNLKGMEEISIKIYYDGKKLRGEMSNTDEEIKKLEESAKGKKPGAYYFEKQKIDSLLTEKLRKKLEGFKEKIMTTLKPDSRDFKQNELLSKKLTSRDMLMNGVFLTNNKDSRKFMDTAKELGIEITEVEIEVWGPFPPYNFIR